MGWLLCKTINQPEAWYHQCLTEGMAQHPFIAQRMQATAQEQPVFLGKPYVEQIKTFIRDFWQLVQSPGFKKSMLEKYTGLAFLPHQGDSVLTTYDFFVDGEGPKLIEINAGADGYWLGSAIQYHYFERNQHYGLHFDVGDFIQKTLWMFLSEHRLSEKPQAMVMAGLDIRDYDDFFFRKIFSKAGIPAYVSHIKHLRCHPATSQLFYLNTPVDYVYMRQFGDHWSKDLPMVAAMRSGKATISPTPYAFYAYEHKSNLTGLSEAVLRGWGLSAEQANQLMAIILPTHEVTPSNIDNLWENRVEYVFKPDNRCRSEGVFWGAHMNDRRLFELLVHQETYIAQAYSHSIKHPVLNDHRGKVEFRFFTYRGEVILIVAKVFEQGRFNSPKLFPVLILQ